MIYVKMLNVHRWHRTWSGLVVEPDTVGELEEIRDGLFSVVWPGQVRPVLCVPSTVEVMEEGILPEAAHTNELLDVGGVTMNILLKVWGDGVENADYALVTIEPAYAVRLLEKVKLAQEVKAQYGHFHQLTFFECGPVLFDGELIGLEQADRLEKEERLVLDKPLFIPLDRQARLDCVMLKVTPEEVRWEGYIKHTDVRWETAAIPPSVLEAVAGVRVGEVQQ